MRNSSPNSRADASGRRPWYQGWNLRVNALPLDEVKLSTWALNMERTQGCAVTSWSIGTKRDRSGP